MDAVQIKIKTAYSFANDELKGWIDLENNYKGITAELNLMQTKYAAL